VNVDLVNVTLCPLLKSSTKSKEVPNWTILHVVCYILELVLCSSLVFFKNNKTTEGHFWCSTHQPKESFAKPVHNRRERLAATAQ
jgi:hypothetical protein